MIRDGVTLVFGQAFFQAANNFPRLHKRVGNPVSEYVR